MGWQAKQCHLMLSRPCKACLCGSSFSKQNLEWTFGSGSVSQKKCVYVRTVDSRITVFTMHVFCCIFAMVFHLYFVVLRELVGAVT